MPKDLYKERIPRKRALVDKPAPEEMPVEPTTATESVELEQAEEVVAPQKVLDTGYHEACSGATIIDALNSVGIDSSFNNRIAIAKANGIPNYYGRPDQNTKLLLLAREGKLKKG